MLHSNDQMIKSNVVPPIAAHAIFEIFRPQMTPRFNFSTLYILFHNFRGDICMRMSQYGHGKGTTQGGCSELSNISSKYLYPINSNITDEQGMGSYSLELFWHINI